MIVRSLLLFLIITVSLTVYGQEELLLYKRIYHTADSLKRTGHISAIDSSIFREAKSLDKKHPSGFFETSGEYLTQSKFNEAAFFYYLGMMRFRYYNAANPRYKPGNDGALLGSLSYVFGQPVNTYLRTDIDNFISVLKMTLQYYQNNDYKYFSKTKNTAKSDDLVQSFTGFIMDLETDKEKYKEQWATERNEMEQHIDTMLKEQQNEENKEEKQK